MSQTPQTLIFARDGMLVAYTSLDHPTADTAGLVGGGLLAGDTDLVEAVRHILTDEMIERVCVAAPNLYYHFTATRSTLADVAAAMLAAGNGRGQLSDLGWDALSQAINNHDDSSLGEGTVH